MAASDFTLRYARHIVLPGFGESGQRKLAGARVFIVGLGGLGSPAALYLAAAGIGELVISDFDRVDLSNLQRQLLHREAAVGRDKTDSAADTLAALNTDTRITPVPERLTGNALLEQARRANVVIDASDNFGTRFALNQACVATRTPLVSGAAIRYEGHVTVFDTNRPNSPCYACLYDEQAEGLEDCRSNGILGPVTGVIGSLQAVEALKLITGAGEPLVGRMFIYNALTGDTRISRYERDPTCPVCAERNT